MSKNFNDKISDHMGDGELASNFGRNAHVWSEIVVRQAMIGYAADLERKLARTRKILDAILAADERGQGIPFSEAMDAAAQWMKDNPEK